MVSRETLNDIHRTLAGRNDLLPSLFSALADERRFKLFTLLSKRSDLCVSDLAAVLGVSVPAASQQLKTLELAGLVRRERLGQKCSYRVRRKDPVVAALVRLTQKGRK
ncbi:MAG: metalloregulator ArsR/SmtB family transcription factor [Patescibacteria group bacterium]